MKKFLFLIIFLNLSLVLAQGIVVCPQPPCTWQNFSQTVNNLIKTVVQISFWVAFLIVTIGAFLIMFGGPRPDLIKRGHEMIWTAIWAYALILFSGIFFDIILGFFTPKLKQPISTTTPTSYIDFNIALAQTSQQPASITSTVFYDPIRDALMSSLKCGENAESITNISALDRLIYCIFEAISLLSRVALILLAFAIIASAFYLITTPLFGFRQISRAYKILIWSIVGFIVILLAKVIRDQIIILK